MGKHTDALKSIEEFRAPWETEDGNETEIDKPKHRRWIFNLMKDKAKAQDARDEALEAIKVAETERDEAKEEAAKANPAETNKKLEKLEADNAKLKDENTSLKSEKELSDLRADVLEGLPAKYAKYVTGTTQDELEKSLEQVKTDFDLGDEGDGEEGEENEGRITPRKNLRNGADGKSAGGSDSAVDFDKVADEILGVY